MYVPFFGDDRGLNYSKRGSHLHLLRLHGCYFSRVLLTHRSSRTFPLPSACYPLASCGKHTAFSNFTSLIDKEGLNLSGPWPNMITCHMQVHYDHERDLERECSTLIFLLKFLSFLFFMYLWIFLFLSSTESFPTLNVGSSKLEISDARGVELLAPPPP